MLSNKVHASDLLEHLQGGILAQNTRKGLAATRSEVVSVQADVLQCCVAQQRLCDGDGAFAAEVVE